MPPGSPVPDGLWPRTASPAAAGVPDHSPTDAVASGRTPRAASRPRASVCDDADMPSDLSAGLRIAQDRLDISTPGRGLTDITASVALIVRTSGMQTGLAQIFVQHTSCSLVITENADPAVHLDLQSYFARLVPDGDPRYIHDDEGPDDMPAHLRSVLTETGLSVPVSGGRLALGTWQGIYLWEHRARGHHRNVVVTLIGQ